MFNFLKIQLAMIMIAIMKIHTTLKDLLESLDESTSDIRTTMLLLICRTFIFDEVPKSVIRLLIDYRQCVTNFHFAFDLEEMIVPITRALISTCIFI